MNIVAAQGAELHRHRQEDRQGAVEEQRPGRQDHARPVVQPGLRRAERQAADHLPRRRRLDLRLQPEGRRADLEVRLQPEGLGLRARRRRHAERLRLHAGRLGEQALHRRRPGPRAQKGVGHLWCIDITKKPKNKDKDLSPAAKPSAKRAASRRRFRSQGPGQQGLRPRLALRRRRARTARGRRLPLRPDAEHLLRPRRAVLRGRVRRLSCTASTPRPARSTGSTTWRPRPGGRRTVWTARSTSATSSGKITVFEPGKKKKILAKNDSMQRQGPGHAGGGQRRALRHDREPVQAVGDQAEVSIGSSSPRETGAVQNAVSRKQWRRGSCSSAPRLRFAAVNVLQEFSG